MRLRVGFLKIGILRIATFNYSSIVKEERANYVLAKHYNYHSGFASDRASRAVCTGNTAISSSNLAHRTQGAGNCSGAGRVATLWAGRAIFLTGGV